MKYLKKFESTETSREIKRLQDEALKKSSETALSGKKWIDVVKEYLEENNIDPKTTKTEELLNILKELNVPNNILYTTIEEVRNS